MNRGLSWALRYGDRVAAAGAGLWLCGLLGAFAGADEASRGALEADVEVVRGALEARRAPAPELPDWVSEVAAQLRGPTAPAEAWPAWCLHDRPNVVYEFGRPEGELPLRMWRAEPGSVEIEVERGQLRVRARGPQLGEMLRVEACWLERRVDEGAWERHAALEGAELELVDAGLRAARSYAYRVASQVSWDEEHPRVVERRRWGMLPALEAELRGEVAAASPLRTYELRPSMVEPGRDGESARLYIKLRLWRGERWVELAVLARVGERLAGERKVGGERVDYDLGVIVEARVERVADARVAGLEREVTVITLRSDDDSTETFRGDAGGDG